MVRVRARGPRIALAAAGGVVVVLGVAQLVLPGVAARRVRSELGRYGSVRAVSVSAFPAIELLWRSADSVDVRAGALRIGFKQAVDELWSARRFTQIRLDADSLRVGPVALRAARVEKDGAALRVRGAIDAAALRAVLPGGFAVRPEASAGGAVRVRASGSLFGVRTTVHALIAARDGKLVVQPQGLPLASLARITIFSDRRVRVEGVALTPRAGAGAAGGEADYTVEVWARLA
jgi:hypothetical protein